MSKATNERDFDQYFSRMMRFTDNIATQRLPSRSWWSVQWGTKFAGSRHLWAWCTAYAVWTLVSGLSWPRGFSLTGCWCCTLHTPTWLSRSLSGCCWSQRYYSDALFLLEAECFCLLKAIIQYGPREIQKSTHLFDIPKKSFASWSYWVAVFFWESLIIWDNFNCLNLYENQTALVHILVILNSRWYSLNYNIKIIYLVIYSCIYLFIFYVTSLNNIYLARMVEIELFGLCLFWNYFISLSNGKQSFVVFLIMGYFFFSPMIWNMSLHSLLACWAFWEFSCGFFCNGLF